MRNIADIIEDDRNGKQLSKTERQIAIAYVQGKYDAVRELKSCNNSNAMEVIDKIRDEVMNITDGEMPERIWNVDVLQIIDKYKAESEVE